MEELPMQSSPQSSFNNEGGLASNIPSSPSGSSKPSHKTRLLQKLYTLPIVIRFLITTILVSILTIPITLALLPILKLANCGGGLDAIGCVFFAGFLVLILRTLLVPFAGVVILSLFRVQFAFRIGLFAGIFSSPFIYASSRVMYIVYFLGLYIGYIIFLRLHIKRRFKIGIIAGIIFVVILFSSFVIHASDTSTADYLNQQQAAVEKLGKEADNRNNLGFYAYMPTYVPQGYKFYANNLNAFGSTPPYYQAEYTSSTNGIPGYTIYSFAKPSYFHPSTDCGPENPNVYFPKMYIAQPCQFIVKLNNGSYLYAVHSGGTNIYNYYTFTGNTEVTLNTTSGGINTNQQDVIDIFNSLQIKSASQLRLLQ